MNRFWLHALRAISIASAVTILAIASGHALAGQGVVPSQIGSGR